MSHLKIALLNDGRDFLFVEDFSNRAARGSLRCDLTSIADNPREAIKAITEMMMKKRMDRSKIWPAG